MMFRAKAKLLALAIVALCQPATVFSAESAMVTNTQILSGDDAFNLKGIGSLTTQGDQSTLTYGELDCIVGFTLMAGAGYAPTQANCKTVNGSPSQVRIDQTKSNELNPNERNIMYLIRKMKASNVDMSPLEGTAYKAQPTFHIRILSIECTGPANESWRASVCKVTTGYSSEERSRQPSSVQKTTKQTEKPKVAR